MTASPYVKSGVLFGLLLLSIILASTIEDRNLVFAQAIVGTPSDDVLQGTPGNDVITGLGGDDVMDSKGGIDQNTGDNDAGDGDGGDDVIDSRGVAINTGDNGIGDEVEIMMISGFQVC